MARSNLFEWDELNIIREDAVRLVQEVRAMQSRPKKKAVDEFCDYLDFVLCLIYAYGWKDAEEIIGAVPMPEGSDDKVVNLEIDGETFRDRVYRQIDEMSEDGLLRIIDTEAHRDYNTGVYDAGKTSGIDGLKKQWWTMADWKVRDQHDYLHGATVGLDDRFYTYTGESALYPGGFGTPELDCNCRCWITLTT